MHFFFLELMLPVEPVAGQRLTRTTTGGGGGDGIDGQNVINLIEKAHSFKHIQRKNEICKKKKVYTGKVLCQID